MKMEEYGTEHGLILKAPSTKGAQKNWQFNCSGGWVTDFLHLYDDFHHSSYEITRDGRLHGYNVSYQDPQGAHIGSHSWDNDKFCVGYADLDYDYEADGEFQLTFNACFDDSPLAKTTSTSSPTSTPSPSASASSSSSSQSESSSGTRISTTGTEAT